MGYAVHGEVLVRQGFHSPGPLGQRLKLGRALLVYPHSLQLCSSLEPRPWLSLRVLATKHRKCCWVYCETALEVCLSLAMTVASAEE